MVSADLSACHETICRRCAKRNTNFGLDAVLLCAYGLGMEKQASQLIKDWLKSDGRKIGWFADRIGAHPSTVSQWLSGARTPHMTTRRAIEVFTGGAVPASSWD
jgi:hypothetical protein